MPVNGGNLVRTLDADLLEAMQVCALPHWLDDSLATELLELTGQNGTSPLLVERVKRLPIVQSFEQSYWRIDETARTELIELLRGHDAFTLLSGFLAKRFADDHETAVDPSSRAS